MSFLNQQRHHELSMRSVATFLYSAQEPQVKEKKFYLFSSEQSVYKASTVRSCTTQTRTTQQNQFLHQAKQSSPTRHNKPIIIRILCSADAGISDQHSAVQELGY
jgi:hypothetical protein